MEKSGQKHLIECKCVLPQFQNKKPVVYHCFVVFSELDEDMNVLEHYEICNNCQAVHKIIDLCKSEVVPTNLLEEEKIQVLEEDYYKKRLSAGIVGALDSNQVELATWKEVYYHFSNGNWGKEIIIKRDDDGDDVVVKVIKVYDRKTFKVEQYTHKKTLINSIKTNE